MIVREIIPTGYVRIMDEGVPLCDAPQEQVERLMRTEGIVWDEDHYTITPQGRAYIKARLLN